MISLLAGKPNPSSFPFTSITFTAKAPPSENDSSATSSSPDLTISLTPSALAEGLQYGPTAGIPSLLDWVTVLQEKVHERKFSKIISDEDGGDGGWRVSIGSGSQDLLYKVNVYCYLDERMTDACIERHSMP